MGIENTNNTYTEYKLNFLSNYYDENQNSCVSPSSSSSLFDGGKNGITQKENTNTQTQTKEGTNKIFEDEGNTGKKEEMIDFNNIPITIDIQKEKPKIFDIKKLFKKNFIITKQGRPPKNTNINKNIILQKKHSSSANDNARKKIFNSCKKNIYDYISQYLPSDIILHVPTVENQMGYSCENIRNFFKKKISQIFFDTIPKRVTDDLKTKREEYNHNKKMMDMIDKGNDKKLKDLLNLTFIDFLMAYLYDLNTITAGENVINLKGFKTFGQCFNEKNNRFNESQKKIYRKHIMDIYQGKIKIRKGRIKNKKRV